MGFAVKAMNPTYVARHSFSPLLHYTKRDIRYKKYPITKERSTVRKDRPIKYASHRDACIFSYYAHLINFNLERFYNEHCLSSNIIAYRSLGQSNYDFSAEVMEFCKSNYPVTILAFDVTGFFDNLDHILLKSRLKSLLGVSDLPNDWYEVYKSITQYHFVDLSELKSHPEFGKRLKDRSLPLIASIAELKSGGIAFYPNPEISKGFRKGIPQGTPISAAVSNAYMMDFDLRLSILCRDCGAMYRRYSDDILIACDPSQSSSLKTAVYDLIGMEHLQIEASKTEETVFDLGSLAPRTEKAAQYLGFTLDEGGAAIRESSLARQWRKLRRALRKAKKSAYWRQRMGKSGKIHTKKLFRRFSYLKVRDDNGARVLRNFSSYARRGATAFGGNQKILAQAKRFERAALKAISRLRH